MQQAHLGKSIKNDMWITNEEEEATPDILPELPGFHVLVRPVSVKEVIMKVEDPKYLDPTFNLTH